MTGCVAGAVAPPAVKRAGRAVGALAVKRLAGAAAAPAVLNGRGRRPPRDGKRTQTRFRPPQSPHGPRTGRRNLAFQQPPRPPQERERRYGNVYTIEDRGGALLVRLEFPRRMPDIGIASRAKLPDEMPDYDYDLALQNGHFIIKGRCADENVRKISSSVGAFPPEFTTVISLSEKVVGFVHRFENKLLEVMLLKEQQNKWGNAYR